MSGYTWRELERADLTTAAAHAFDMEYRAEQIASEARKHLARIEHIVNGLGEVKGEIVRCRSCVYFASNQPETGWCAKFGANTEQDGGDGFCAWGNRRGKPTSEYMRDCPVDGSRLSIIRTEDGYEVRCDVCNRTEYAPTIERAIRCMESDEVVEPCR